VSVAEQVADEIYGLHCDIGRLEVENARLHKLVHILCFCMQDHNDCDDCVLNGAKGELAFDPLCTCDGLHKLLREVGVEVEQ
jgi:hypothetical protein